MAVGIEQNFADLPLSTLIALVTVVTIAGAIAIRVISNTFHGNRPPVDEGIPFVGGLIKFSKVSRQVKFVCGCSSSSVQCDFFPGMDCKCYLACLLSNLFD